MTDNKVKTKRMVLVSVLSVFCVFMFVLLIAYFNDDSANPTDLQATETTAEEAESEIVITTKPVTTTAPPVTTKVPPENADAVPDKEQNGDEPQTGDRQKNNESANVVEQNFPEATKPEPPENPANQLPEEVLTNPDKQPTYQPKQTRVEQVTTAPKSDTPYNGQKKDGKVYLEGFGWVIDEGGVAKGEVAEGMVQNGNKIGTFG